MKYAFQQIVDAFSAPMGLGLVLCAIALVVRRRRPAVARWFVAVAAVFLYVVSTTPGATLLLGPLESRYVALRDASTLAPAYVVVLGSGFSPRDGLPPTSSLDAEGLARIVEGIRLLRQVPTAHLVVCGGAPDGRPAPARGYALLAGELGVDPGSVVVLDRALDTAAESRFIATVVGKKEFVLVTSASHMPRAMALMQSRGLNAIAAPTAHRIDRTARFGWRSIIPGSGPLRSSELAIHEYLGLAALVLGVSG